MLDQYFVRRDDTVKGPITAMQLKSGIATKKIRATDWVAASESGPWKPISELGELGNSDDPSLSNDSPVDPAPSAAVSVLIDSTRVGVNDTTRPSTDLAPGEDQVPAVSAEPQPGGLRSVLERLTTDSQDPKVVKRVQQRIQDILMSDEELLYIAIQNKPIVKIAPDCIVLTNKRFIIYKPTVLGRVSFDDYVWRELRDAKLKEGIMGATISVQTASGNHLAIDYLPKPQARQIYRLVQEQEEKALEERRQRSLEESRAAAGGVVVQSAVGGPAPPTTQTDDPVATLQKLKTMLDAELITAEEYEKKKLEIVAQM